MKRAVVALLLIVSMVGCFPHNAQHRTYAKLGEGTAIVAGIAISAFANSSADCDQMVTGLNGGDASCKSSAQWASTAGVALIVGGLLGFVATVSTAEQEKPKAVEIKDVTPAKADAKPEAKPEPTAPAAPEKTDNQQATDPQSADSGSGSPSAPQR